MRDHILSEIRRLAGEDGGKAPGGSSFESRTGTKRSQWRGRLRVRRNQAVERAGLLPNTVTPKNGADTISDCLEVACRHHRRFPTDAEWKMHARGRPDAVGINAFRRESGGRDGAIAALGRRATERGQEELLEILPNAESKAEEEDVSSKGGFSRRQEIDHFVFLARSDNLRLFKNGQARNVESRTGTLRTADPSFEPARKIKARDPGVIEECWHDLFCEQREEKGELFASSRCHVKYFKSFKRQ